MRARILIAAILLLSRVSWGQGLEGVYVETYAVSPAAKAGEPPLITYRIYIDMAPDHTLQMIYGDRAHQLKIGTAGFFLNDTINGSKYGDRIQDGELNTWPLALDSWLTVGEVGEHYLAVPKHLDTDGSVLTCPPYLKKDAAGYGASGMDAGTPLCIADGLLRDTTNRPIVDFKFSSGYLHKVGGNLLETDDGAWAALGGRAGATPENMVLIAQITAVGRLYYTLNVQIAGPDGLPVKYVAHDPAEGEILFEGLGSGPSTY